MAVENVDQKYEVTVRFRLIRNCMLLSGISVFAQLYLFQPILSDLCRFFSITPATSSLTVSITTVGIAVGLFGHLRLIVYRAKSLWAFRLYYHLL